MKISQVFIVFIGLFLFGFSQSEGVDSNLVRLGSSYGGWVIPQIFSSNSVCYCVGAGEDISFDLELAKNFGCEVFVIDPTPRACLHFNYVKESILKGLVPYTNAAKPVLYVATPASVEKLHFLSYGLWVNDETIKFYSPKNPSHVSHSILNLQKTEDYFEAQCKKISTLMAELGHDHIDLLKMDIEGAEYSVIENFLQEKISIRCLCVEFHEAEKNQRIVRLLQENGFDLVHSEGKNSTFVSRRY